MKGHYLSGLESALLGAGLPYGYAITIWSSGALLTGARGSPAVWMVFLFAAGAAAAYGLLRWTVRQVEPAQAQLAASPHLLRAGMIHVAAIGAAAGAVALIGHIPSPVAWPLGGFAATLIYLGGVSVETALREAERED